MNLITDDREKTDAEILQELEIRNESLFALETELRESPKKEGEFIFAAAQATKELEELELELKVLIAEIVQELMKNGIDGKQVPPSAIRELRHSFVPLDKRFKQVSRKAIHAKEKASILSGIAKSWVSRGFRLQELLELSKRTLWGEPRVYDERYKDRYKSYEEKLDEMGEALEGGE